MPPLAIRRPPFEVWVEGVAEPRHRCVVAAVRVGVRQHVLVTMAEALLEFRIHRSIAQIGGRLHLIDATELRQQALIGDRIGRVDVQHLVVVIRPVVDSIRVDREVVSQIV